MKARLSEKMEAENAWNTLCGDGPIFNVIEAADGTNPGNAQVRSDKFGRWLYVDSADGYRFACGREIIRLKLEMVEV
jgi:hypothetical protein